MMTGRVIKAGPCLWWISCSSCCNDLLVGRCASGRSLIDVRRSRPPVPGWGRRKERVDRPGPGRASCCAAATAGNDESGKRGDETNARRTPTERERRCS